MSLALPQLHGRPEHESLHVLTGVDSKVNVYFVQKIIIYLIETIRLRKCVPFVSNERRPMSFNRARSKGHQQRG